MGRSRKQSPQVQDDLVENRFDAAIDYAIELLTGFAETAESVTVAVLLDGLLLETKPPSALDQTNSAFSTIARKTPASNGAKPEVYLVIMG